MSKSNLENILKTDGHYAGDLVSLDFKSESLHAFLENVVQLVNHHSQRINALEIDKMAIESVRIANSEYYAATKIPPMLAKELTLPSGGQAKFETHSESVNALSSNFKMHCNATQYLYEKLARANERIEQLTGQLDSFQTKENVKEALRKTGLASKKQSEQDVEKVLTRLKEVEMRTNKKIGEFENATKELQKKTLWKISECETSLLKKITPEYVERAMEQLESKIINDIANSKNQQANELKFNLENLKAKLESLSRIVDDHDRQNKQLLQELQQECKTLVRREKADQDLRDMDVRVKELLIKIDRLEKREDPQELDLRISKEIAKHEGLLVAQQDKIKQLEMTLDSLNSVIGDLGGGSNGAMDPHKLCHIDGEVRRLRDSTRTNQLKLQTLDDEVKKKLLIFEQRVLSTLGMLKGQDNFVSREEMYQSLSRLRDPINEKINENQQLLNQLNGKLSKLEQFEKVTKRKIKQMTRGNDLNSLLDLKMNVGQAEAQFSAQNMKIENMDLVLNRLRMEVEANTNFLHVLQEEMNDPEEGINIIGPKQKVFPAKCLGCGYKHIPAVHDNNMMQGTDGKYYKVDLRNSYVNDQREVYGVTPSQIAIYDSGTKKRITSAAQRPTSSRTNLRPSSAKHF